MLVLERRAHPVPQAAHKVGESSVEIGAHYFDTVLGLKPHLHGAQLRKFGFRFFFSEGRRDIDQVTELGASRYLSVPSYQIDRGIFENYLAEEAARRGVRFVDGALVRQHRPGRRRRASRTALGWTQDGADARRRTRAGWSTPAAAPACSSASSAWPSRTRTTCNAVWFRIGERITIDDWSDNADWRARCDPPARWLSTNHLVGAGYWVWLIPLASGSHSVGIVADPRMHPLDTINTFDKAMDWFATLPAAPVRRARRQAPPAAGLRVLPQLLVRLQAGVLGPALGADRRGRAVPRPVLFAGQRLHRDRATPTSPT